MKILDGNSPEFRDNFDVHVYKFIEGGWNSLFARLDDTRVGRQVVTLDFSSDKRRPVAVVKIRLSFR